jgi:hypothetical protein
MGTDMQAFDSKNFSRLLLRNVAPVGAATGASRGGGSFSRLLLAAAPAARSDVSSLSPSYSTSSSSSSSTTSSSSPSTIRVSRVEYRYDDVFENLVQLLDGRDQRSLLSERRLAERAVEHLLRQREDDASSYEILRFFHGATCFLAPPVGLFFGGIGGCCVTPESNAVWMPWVFRDSNVDGWKEESQMQMMADLNHYIKRHTDRQIAFQITGVVFRLKVPGFERDVKIRMKINGAYNRALARHHELYQSDGDEKVDDEDSDWGIGPDNSPLVGGRDESSAAAAAAAAAAAGFALGRSCHGKDGGCGGGGLQVPAFFISCPENIHIQRKAQDALDVGFNIKTLLADETAHPGQMPWELRIQKAVMAQLKSVFVDREVRPLATSIGVWEVRLHCHFRLNDPTFHSKNVSLTSSPNRNIKPPPLHRSGSEATAQELSGSEVVYQHASQTIEFHNSVSEYDYFSEQQPHLSTSPCTAAVSTTTFATSPRMAAHAAAYASLAPPSLVRQTSEEEQNQQAFKSNYRRRIERIRRGFITIVRRSVLKRSWWRMMFHHLLLFLSMVFSVVLWYVARFAAEDAYSCAMPHKPTPKDKSKCARMKSLVSSAEILRVVALFLILGVMSSMKNMWLMNTQSTKTGRLSSREAVYVKAFEDIADLPRLGLHHQDVGRVLPYWMSAFWVIIPIQRRMDGNSFGWSQLVSRTFRLAVKLLGHYTSSMSSGGGSGDSIAAIVGAFLHRQNIVVHMPGTGNKRVSPPVPAMTANVSMTEIMGASMLGTNHGLTGWDTTDLAMFGVMLVAIASIVSSIVARSCAVFFSLPCWEGLLPLLRGWKNVCCRTKSAGFSSTYENFFFLSMFAAGIVAPPFVTVLFSEQPRPSGIRGATMGWDGDYLLDGDDIGGDGNGDMMHTALVIFLAYWGSFFLWFAIVRKLLLRDTWFHFVEMVLILSCSVLVLTVTLVRALPVAAASIGRASERANDSNNQSLPKSTNMAVILSTAATAYILISTFLTIMHGNYVYFERLTKIMDLFTKASMHASWYTFFRNFSRASRERGCSLLRCCAKCQRCESVLERVKDLEAQRMSEHNMVIERVKKGPINAQGTGRDAKMAFTAFDLSGKADVIHWNQTRMRLIHECNSAESQVRMVSLHFLTIITALLVAVTILRRFVELLDAKHDHTGRLRMVETSISNSSNMLMQGFLLLGLVCFLPTMYQRLRLAQMQEQHISLLVDAKHRVRILIGASGLRMRRRRQSERSGHTADELDDVGFGGAGSGEWGSGGSSSSSSSRRERRERHEEEEDERIDEERSKEELEDVIELLEESINKLEHSDAKPLLFGVELEAFSARNVFSLLASLLGVWFYFETRGAIGG